MSPKHFHVRSHTIPAQHIRQYPHAINGKQETPLSLAIKQYTPKNNPNPQPGDITIIAAHANGYPKELYEPLWDDMLELADGAGFRIRGIWIADVAYQGQSGVLNESSLGNDPSWWDHPRDLLHMINYFRTEMVRPFFGVAHSMGGNNIVNLALMHPRLFQSLILMDPVIQSLEIGGAFPPAVASSRRRDRWPSRSVARKTFLQSSYYQAWDPRVFDLWMQYGLRELPTALYPEAQSNPQPTAVVGADATSVTVAEPEREVTLTTTKHNEVMSFVRHRHSPNDQASERLLHFELESPDQVLYRPEEQITFRNLPYLHPSVLYVLGDQSWLSRPAARDEKLATTGIGIGGSGGVAKGKVKAVVMEDIGHLMPLEDVRGVARICAEWLEKEVAQFRRDEEDLARMWAAVPKGEENKLSSALMRELRPEDYRADEAGKGKDRSKL